VKYAIRIVNVPSFVHFERRWGAMSYSMANKITSSCLLKDRYIAETQLKFLTDNNKELVLELVEMTEKEAFDKILRGDSV